jgi:WD40 repeat protein
MEVKSSDFSDVFVSYRRVDVEFTKKLVEALQADGKQVWIDWEDIPPGSVGFSDDIKRGLEGADAFIAVLTPDYLASPYCMELELKYAVELKKKLIPVVLKKFDGQVIPADISHINWIYFTPHAGHENSFEESLPKVKQALDTDLVHVRTHKQFLLRALEWNNNERKPSYLLRGNVLNEAESWLAAATDKVPNPTELHAQFTLESRKAATAQQRRLIAFASVAAVVMAILSVFAAFQWREAERNKQIAEANEQLAVRNAEESRSLALAANSQLNLNNNNLDLAIALALQGSTIPEPPQDTVLVLDEAAHLPGTQFVLRGHEGAVNAVALNAAENRVLSGGADTKLFLWNIETGEQVAELIGHEAAINSIAFQHVGETAASADANGMVILWDTATGEEIRRFEAEHDAANVVVFTPDDESLLVGYTDNTVIRYDAASGDVIWEQTEHANAVTALAISPDGTQFAAGEGEGSDDNPTTLIISELESGEVISSTSEIGTAINDIDYAPSGNALYLALTRLNIVVWDIAENQIIRELAGHTGNVWATSLTADGSMLVSVSEDYFARLWAIGGTNDGTELWRFAGHLAAVEDLAVTANGKTLVTASRDGTLRVWQTQNGAVEQTMRGHSELVANVDFGADDTEGYSVSWDGLAVRWDLEAAETSVVFNEIQSFITGLDYDPTTGLVLLSNAYNELVLWNPATNEIVYNLDAFHESWVTNVAFTSDGTRAVSVANDGGIAFWNLTDGTLINGFVVADLKIRDVDISSDDAQAVVITSTGVIIVYDMATQEEVTRWVSGGNIAGWSVQFLPNSTQVAIAQADNNITLYDSANGDLIRTFTGHSGSVNDIDVSDDGTLLLSGSEDRSLRLWDIAMGTELRRLNLDNNVLSVALNSGTTQALVGLENTALLLVNIQPQSAEELMEWTRANRFVADFTCIQRQFYRLDMGDCEL